MSFSERFCNYYPPMLEPAVQDFQTHLRFRTKEGKRYDLTKSPEQIAQDNFIYSYSIEEVNILQEQLAEHQKMLGSITKPKILQQRSDKLGVLLSLMLGLATTMRYGVNGLENLLRDNNEAGLSDISMAITCFLLITTLTPYVKKIRENSRNRFPRS